MPTTASTAASAEQKPTVSFEVPGVPVPKGRPRFVVRGGFAKSYTPSQTREAEEVIRWVAKQYIKQPLDGAIILQVDFYLPIPKALAKRIPAYHIKRPDGDNLMKLVLDALNGIAYHDDAQVVTSVANKLYGTSPRTAIIINTAP